MKPLPTLSEIEAAKVLIRPHIRETPMYRWPLLEAGLGCELWLKHENHTPVGAFKIRGGLVYMDELKRTQPDVLGVIAPYSTVFLVALRLIPMRSLSKFVVLFLKFAPHFCRRICGSSKNGISTPGPGAFNW